MRIPYGKVSQEVGQDTLLECLISANPLSAAWWERGGVRLEDDVKYRIHLWEIGGYTRTLGAFIHDLQPYDYGEYTCVAENQFGRIRDTTIVYGTYHDFVTSFLLALSISGVGYTMCECLCELFEGNLFQFISLPAHARINQG